LALGCSMLLRRRGTALSILAIALLVAILASASSVINYLDLQAQVLGGLVSPGRTFLVLSGGAASIADSRVDAELARRLSGLSYFEYVLPQRVVKANLTTRYGSNAIWVRGVEGVGSFLKARRAYLNGSVAKGWSEADVGELLARALSISLGDEVGLAVGDRQVEVRVVGVFRSQMQSDAELVVPMEAAERLAGDNDTISFVELSLKEGVDSREAISQLAQLLPEGVRLVQAQQLREFTQQMSMETLAFLSVWSLAVYAAIAAASYVTASRLVAESSYELAMLRALGAKKQAPLTLVFTYTTLVAFMGSTLGVALGTAGTQAASTMLRWIQPSVEVAPFLKAEQALQTLLLTLASSILGCMHPALKAARARYVERPL